MNENGLYCSVGDFYIDPWRPVPFAIITHGHSDHAKARHQAYLCEQSSANILKIRLGSHIPLQTLRYGESLSHNRVKISLHPAGHILGSAQVRVEYQGEVWVVTGDYKRDGDPTCVPFEPVPCHTLITESTFGLPVFQWGDSNLVMKEINRWWNSHATEGKLCRIYAYSLGKAQRLLSQLEPGIGKIYTSPSILQMNRAYEKEGILLPAVEPLSSERPEPGSLILAPPSSENRLWEDDTTEVSSAHASGWMAVRSLRSRDKTDKGFVLSDHADWKGIHQTIQECRPERVLVTHGFVSPLVRYLNETGMEAFALDTPFQVESPVADNSGI